MKKYLLSTGDFPVLNINQIGYSDEIPVTHHGPARRQLYIIHYILRGRGYFNNQELGRGQGFLIRPGDFEEYHADLEDPWEFLWVVSDDNNMEKIFSVFRANDGNVFNYDYVSAVFEVVYRIKKIKKNILSRCEMLDVFLELLTHQECSGLQVRTPSEKLYTDIASSYIKENLGSEITVNGLSGLLGVSRPYLYKIFLSAYGKSPKQYINELRIEHAKHLLKESELSISEVGCYVGYHDVLSFSKFFSLKTGASPSEYRKNKKEEG